jgi:hypothetical protein
VRVSPAAQPATSSPPSGPAAPKPFSVPRASWLFDRNVTYARLRPLYVLPAVASVDSSSVRRWNEQVRKLAGMVPDGLERYGFACECGCGETVGLTANQYDRAGGAWADGHKSAQPVQ